MLDRLSYLGLPFLATVLLHALVIAVLTLRWPETKTVVAAVPKTLPVQAVLVDAEALKPNPKPAAQEKPDIAEPKPKPTPKPKPEVRPEPSQEAARPSPPAPEPAKPELTEEELALRARSELEAVLAAEVDARMSEAASLTDTIAAIIRQAVVSRWTRPPSARNGMEVVLSIAMVPTGDVVGVSVLSSSGNSAFDRSAMSAVERAGRFPEVTKLPRDDFERDFRRFQLIFRPEDLRY